jgi:YceI-like domain
MVSTVRGTLGRVSGTVDYDGKSLDSVKADVTIDVAGLNTGTEGRDKDLRSPNFFDVANYPTITFKSKKVEPAGSGPFQAHRRSDDTRRHEGSDARRGRTVAAIEAAERRAEDRRNGDDEVESA